MVIIVSIAVVFVLLSPLVVLPTSSTVVKVIRHSGNFPQADAYSNEGCKPSYCQDKGTTCYDPTCCYCQCPNAKANYIANEWICKSRTELNEMSSTSCKYSLRKPNEPLLALPLTDVMAQKVTFTDDLANGHQTLVVCNEKVKVKWQYRDPFGKWKDGKADIFKVSGYLLHGEPRNRHVLKHLEWTGKLDSKFAGMLIKFILTCEGQEKGCFLSKTSGTHSYDMAPPVVKPTAQSKGESPNGESPNGESPNGESPNGESPKGKANAQNQGNAQKTSTGGAGATFGPIFGLLGLLCLIGLLAAVVVYKRRRKRQRADAETNSVATLEEYQEPIYADINKGDFENAVYCDPTLDPSNRLSRLGPLPDIPGSTYQPLNSLTRNSKDYDNPIGETKPEIDYDNPPAGMKNTEDYDNPPVKNSMENTEDYDNPPVKNSMENTEDYDNPPVKNSMENTEDYDNPPVTDGMKSTGDYDNPLVTDGMQDTGDYDNPPVKNEPDTPEADHSNTDSIEVTSF